MLMEIVDKLEDKTISEGLICVLTGDGSTEFRVLRALSERYDGKGIVLFTPGLPFPLRTGMVALCSIKNYLSLYKVQNILFIIDKDVITNDLLTDVKKVFSTYGIRLFSEKKEIIEGEESLIIKVLVGNHEATIYIAVNGKEKEIEENIAKLIELEYDKTVPPNKQEINKKLECIGVSMTALLKKAEQKNISLAFPSLDLALKEVESSIRLSKSN